LPFHKQPHYINKSSYESARQAIREKYAVIQSQIDAASTAEEIKTSLGI